MLEARLIEELDALTALRPEWDELADSAGLPNSSPAWLLPWWRHISPPSALLRTPAVFEAGRLVGIAPIFVQHEGSGFFEYRLLGAGSAHRIDPPIRAGMEDQVGPLIASCLAAARPRASTLRLEGIDAASPLPSLLVRSWDGLLRPWLHQDVVLAAPTVSLVDLDYEQWLASKSRNFRRDMRRKRRRLEAAGGTIRMIEDEGELAEAIQSLLRLHHARWAKRGGSKALGDAEQALLLDSAPEMLAKRRIRLWVIEADGEIVGALLCFTAGGRVASWASGFNDEWSRFSPELLLTMAVIEDSFHRGDSVFDLGGGDYPYKLRFADGNAPIDWLTLFPRGIRYPLARAHTLPRHTFWRTRRWARQHLRPETQERAKRLLRRG